jgi:hypothetical protein
MQGKDLSRFGGGLPKRNSAITIASIMKTKMASETLTLNIFLSQLVCMSYLSCTFVLFVIYFCSCIGTTCILHPICAVLCKVQLTRALKIKRTCYKPLMYALAKKNGDAQLVDDLDASDSERDSESDDVM